MISVSRWSAGALALGCALLVSSCATIHASSDYYPGADFSKYHKYAWVTDSPLIRSESTRVQISALTVRRVREAIERVLESKGFEQVASRDNAEFALAFTVGARDMITMDNYPPYYRGTWDWSPYFGPYVSPDMYTEGMLGIDVFDVSTHEPVWHGWARKTIVGADIDDPESTINAAVAAILADFPPKSQ
ncbi:MAG TPA: DUF4136 domain-containing protein [Gammaproteobacteria bacterium]|jgi:hypothetical protein|nr:DUF4136 domain-containing protein [Gammaproteobacteria bacterium]